MYEIIYYKYAVYIYMYVTSDKNIVTKIKNKIRVYMYIV